MLQPRVLSGSEMGLINCVKWGAVVVLLVTLTTCQEINDHEPIEVSRIKREGVPENRDLTVLLVNDQKRNDYASKTGRYHSVKPLIGLLTSTARTFIQDGVTTEFATQILGTTLDNGRIYAQVLTKSSLVLYSKPYNDDPFIVSPTRAPSLDGWNVKQDLGIIDPEKFVLKNTDYLAPSSKMNLVYPSKLAKENFKLWNIPNENQINEEPTARRVQAYNEIPKFEVYNYLDGPAIDNEKNVEYVERPSILVDNVNNKYRQSKAYEPMFESIKDTVKEEDVLKESNIVKVKPNYDLPTFTIKNEFSPIFYYIDNVESRQPAQQTLPQTKLPKNLFGHKTEPKPKKTFTYQGFADFTTIVGDTVIIFTPNTDTIRQPNPDEVNVFPSAKLVDKLATKITFLSADIPVATSTYNAHEINTASKLTTPGEIEDTTHQSLNNDEESAEKEFYDLHDKIPDSVRVQYSSGFDLNLDVIQPSEPVYTTTESTQNTDDLSNLAINEQSSQATEPLTTLTPSSTWLEEYKGSVVTEGNINELFTNSEEETENTAAEITETTDEDEESEEHESTQEMEPEILTTTESGHSEESEEIETTTENIYNKHEEVFCNDGLETQSTMTTEYKTLTYLTTYFIPLESTDTTTSVKSDVIVESNVGYLTNVVCKTNSIDIKPTAVITLDVKQTERINKEDSDNIENNQEDPLTNAITEKTPITTPMQKEIFTTVQDEELNNDLKKSKISLGEKQTTETISPEAEHVSTSQSHVEVSVSTEHTPTERPNYTETQEEGNESENEIDLIFKTLYTTYTYFTTFFGDQTSSVASHKSIVTNIITSTIDLSKLDPSIFGAFDDDEISPTNVGIGRPTETFAINSIIDLVKNKDVIESVEVGAQYSSQTPTPILGDDVITSINPDSVKTYFTTYTFFTTIYVGSDANVCSRNEVYTNYVGPDELIPTKTNPLIENTRAQFDFRNCKQVKGQIEEKNENSYEKSIESSVSVKQSNLKDDFKIISPQTTSIEVDMLFSVDSNPLISENSYVTDVKSSSSKGETKYLDNNNVLDDQISSESNIDEIMPSPTLLLQTSYTTFTYFTTMYIGKDSSKVKSRLETITNVVTETITPKTEPEEENNLPITYYTTFTYWTTLYKDKSTTITSREEIVSNVVTPTVQVVQTETPIDTSPIDIESVLPSKELEVKLNPSLLEGSLEHEDGKATFFTTYTYFTTFYTGNTSLIRSSLATVTNIVDNTKVLEDNQLGRKVPTGAIDNNLIQDKGEKISNIIPTPIKEEIKTTQLPDMSSVTTTVLQGTYIDNLFAEVKPQEIIEPKTEQEKKMIFSQVAVISGDSIVVTNDNKTLDDTTTVTTTSSTTTESSNILTSNPEVIESSVTDPETTTNSQLSEEEDDDSISRKRGRLSFTTKKPTFTPVIIPFASRNRPTFSPKRQSLPNSATTITRPEFTPTITATPTLKSVRQTGNFGGNRKPSVVGSSSISGRRFSGRSSATLNLSANVPASRPGGFGRASIQPSSRRTGFRSSSLRVNSLDYASKSAVPKIRPTATSRLRVGRQSSPAFNTPPDQNEYDTYATQLDENATEALDEITESPVRQITNNPLLRFRRPPVARQPGTALIPRATTPTPRRVVSTRGRITTTTRRTTTRTTNNPLLSLRRQRPNSLFPRRNLFKQPEPEPEEEIRENEQKVDESDEILEEEEFEEDNDYDSSDRREQKVATPPPASKRSNVVSIRPFGFKRRVRRQVDYGTRKYNNFRRPGTKSVNTRKPDPEPETEAPAPQLPKTGRYNARLSTNSRSTTVSSPKSSARQPFIVRGESRMTTTSSPAYKRGGKSRTSSRTTTLSSRPKAPRLSGKSSPSTRSNSARTTSRSRARTTTSKASSRQRSSFENLSGERYNKYDNLLNDGKITVTHQIPIEVTIPVVNGKITEYKNVLTAKPSVETLLLNQVATSIGPLGNQQLVLAMESTELADNGATKLIKFVLHETPTTTIIFTPTTIRGRKTSYSHILPSTVYNVKPVIQTVAPEINANVPLANLLLSQLLLGNQQPAINPLLALQGQALLPQQPVVQTPVTEYKTRSTTYVTTVTDARETVLPITFRGIPILTTIVDPTTNVITATEYITDTVVTTPTVLAPQPQFNSLLLPLLLQQQQQQQQSLSLQTANPLLGLSQSDLNLLSNNLGQNNIGQNNNMNNDIYSNSPKPNVLSDFNSNEDFSEDNQNDEEDAPPPSPPPSRRRHRAKAAKPSPPKVASVVTLYVSGKHPAFNTNGIVYDNTPWRPGRNADLANRSSEEDERKIKSLATRIMSNGVEVLVKDKSSDGKQEQRMLKLMHISSTKPHYGDASQNKTLLSSAVATVVSRQQMSDIFPIHHFMQHNYIIKTCMTTYTYLTTIVHNKRSAISTFETIVSVVTTESLTNLYASEVLAELKPTKTKYMEVKTVQSTGINTMYLDNLPKIDKRIDSNEDDSMFDLIQPSEISHVPCATTSCSCSHTKTEGLQSKYTHAIDMVGASENHGSKTTKREVPKHDIKTTNKESLEMKTKYRPYDYEINSPITPTDRIVEKYTEVINDYSDEKNTNTLEASELLTNEQAPALTKINKVSNNKTSEKVKPEKPPKPNKNKLVVAELIKLGSLGIKGLSQLAPVFEKMTGSFMKRQDVNQSTKPTTTKPITKLTPYAADKRVDSMETKKGNFPIYIPVDDMETSESQVTFSNVSMQPNFPWALEYKHSKGNILPPKIVQESPLVNGGIPISPGEIIRANSDVIVGKPAVGGPLTLAASGIKLNNAVNRPPLDSFMADSEQYAVNEQYPLSLPQNKKTNGMHVDDSFDLRPPEPPKSTSKPHRRPSLSTHGHQSLPSNHDILYSTQGIITGPNERINQSDKLKSSIDKEHGRPGFLDYMPSYVKPTNSIPAKQHVEFRPYNENKKEQDITDSSPSSSEIVSSKIHTTDEESNLSDSSESIDKPFLVDIQPSRVANVLIPHGSSTALVFAGSSEPHKTGDYIDDPLPYPEPGYFGSFSIDAPQMTNVHSVTPNKSQFLKETSIHFSAESLPSYNQNIQFNDNRNLTRNDEQNWKNNQRYNLQNIPPPISVQETHLRVGPQITVYKPDNYKEDFDKYKQNKNPKSKNGKEIIDREYENYLAVPPPPPKQQFNQDSHFTISNKPYSQRPIIHTKPVQDMKIFLNVQHPVPDQLPPKITSEVYFASQTPNKAQSSTYNIQVPKLPSINNQQYNKHISGHQTPQSNTFSIISSPNIANKSIITNIGNDNTYSITLNTGTGIKNVDGNTHMVGSSITVPISTSENNGEINANIPIGTNFAIRVEDDPSKYDTVALHGKPDPSLSLLSNEPLKTFNKPLSENNVQTSNKFIGTQKDVITSMPPSFNSHANFPMLNEQSSYNVINSKDISSEIYEDKKSNDQKRPGKIISNIPTNSHVWYSSVINDNNLKQLNINNMDITTQKVIPLTFDFKKNTLPNISTKVINAGKPPSEFLDVYAKLKGNKFNIGRPFSKQKESDIIKTKDKQADSTFSIKPNYIPSIYTIAQPVYDIPVIENSDEEITNIGFPENSKPVYETSEEIYDGKDDFDESEGEIDGEVSSESMKIPIVTSSKETQNNSTSTVNIISSKPLNSQKHVQMNNFNSGTQTEKPFGSHNITQFHSNNMSPILTHNNPYMKPRPFSSSLPLDHQLQQPHWQINQMMENDTNASYEDGFDLNTGEKIYKTIYNDSMTVSNKSDSELDNSKKVIDSQVEATYKNNSNIITSTVHIKDKKPLVIEGPAKSTLPTFTKSDTENNQTYNDIINLSPPPPNNNYARPNQNNELIMGMSPPPPNTVSLNRYPSRNPQTPRPTLPIRTPPPYRNIPPRKLPPRPSTQRPLRKPVIKDEVSTYRPTYDVVNKIKRPFYNRDQPSSLLLPPPRELPTKTPESDLISASTPIVSSVSNIIFPTPISSGWLTSSGVDFSSRFNFAPTAVQYSDIITSSNPAQLDTKATESSNEKYEDVYNQNYDNNKKKDLPTMQDEYKIFNNSKTQTLTFSNSTNIYYNDSSIESSQEDLTTDKTKVKPLETKNRTRKPYPVRTEDKRGSKYKPSYKSTIITPTRTLSRPEILYSTKQVTNKVKPTFINFPSIQPLDIIESSETLLEEDFIKPTQTLNEYDDIPTIPPKRTTSIRKTVTSTLTLSKNDGNINTQVHHAGNEIKISDEIIPTKTEFKTTVVTFTKTLSETPKIISSVGYVNLTHTLTVTHTKTSLVSQSEGAVTQTLILTNTHTSTVVDVITEIYTQVQPTTIIETVTRHVPIVQLEVTPVQEIGSTKIPLDDISMSSEEKDNFIIKDSDVTENIQKIEAEEEKDSDTFFVVMNKSQNGGKSPPINTDIETGDYDGITRNEQVNNNGVSQVLFGEILLAGTPYLETTNIGHPAGIGFGKECQPDCKASRNERCQRIDGLMKCVCRPGFARMFPDRPCKPTYTYSVSLVLASHGNQRLKFHPNLKDNSTKEYHQLAIATNEGINRMVMQSDLRDVFHGVHITGFHPVEMKDKNGELHQGVTNDFYVQLSDNAHEYRLKEVIEKYLRNNNYSLGGTEVHAAADHIDRLSVSDFDECRSGQFHDCSEHSKCFNLRGTYTCSCLEGYADLSVNTLYPGRICSSEAVGCDTCNYHGTCFDRESAVICECFKWYAGRTCQVNLKAVLITVTVSGLLIIMVVTIFASRRCCASRSPATQTFVIGCMQGMPSLHQGNMPKQRADRRALIAERENAETCSVQNASLPYIPSKRGRSSTSQKCVMSEPPAHAPPPPPAPAVLIPRARLHQHSDSRDNLSRKKSLEACAEAKLISYLESGATNATDEMRRKHSLESSYSANKDRHNKQGALISAGFKVSTTVRPEEGMKEDDASSINKTDIDGQLSRFDTLRKSYSQEDNMSEWTDAERRLGELTLSEARSVGGTLPASTGRAASSTRLTHQEAHTMAERDLGSTFLLPHVHLYKPDPTSDVSEFDSL